MDSLTNTPTCPNCFEAYTAAADQRNRYPTIVCKGGYHTVCSTCANYLDKCLTCRGPKIKEVKPNNQILDAIAVRQRETLTLNNAGVFEISADHVKLAARPFASGAYADVYNVWQKPSVALKVLRRRVVTSSVLHDVLQQVRLAMSINHPNLVRVLGVVSIDGGKGILMDKADRGSLRSALDATNEFSLYQRVSVSIDIVDGLDYIHSRQMVHRDLKPENVLLFDIESRLTAKIADFGTSKVIQSSLAGTATVGTSYYMAPELFKPQVRYGAKVDVYSMAAVFYEVFSGRNIRDAYAGIESQVELLKCVESGQRPEIPESFPAALRTVVERGLSADAKIRPMLVSYEVALCRFKASMYYTNPAGSRISGTIASTSTSASTDANTSTNASTTRSSADADVYAAFEARLHELEQSVKAYKLSDARKQVEACWSLWTSLGDRTTASASTARFHSVKGYVHHWFGECPDAYAETYQALTELYELCVSGTSVEGEEVVKVLRYAVEVCESQCWYRAMVVLLSYAVRYAKSKLSEEAYADVLECYGLFWHFGKWSKIAEFVLSTRLKAAADEPDVNVAIAHYHLAQALYHEHLDSDKDFSVALKHVGSSRSIMWDIDENHIWYAICWRFDELVTNKAQNKADCVDCCKHTQRKLNIAPRILGDNNLTVSLIQLSYAESLKIHASSFLHKAGSVGRKSYNLCYFRDAENMFKIAIKSAAKSLCPNSWFYLDALQYLADFYINEMEEHQEAEYLYLQSIEICKTMYGPGSRRLSRLYASLADCYTKSGQTDKADTYSLLKSDVDSGKLENKTRSIEEALNMLAEEVLKPGESGDEVGESPGELVDVLRKFFEVAPKPESPQ